LAGIRAILFDWGGTLCSVAGEERAWGRCVEAVLRAGRAAGLPLGDQQVGALAAVHQRVREAAEKDPVHREINFAAALRSWVVAQGIAAPPEDVVQAMCAAYFDEWVGCLAVIGEADRALGELKHRGYRLGMVSNVVVPPKWCRRELERLGLWDLFDAPTFSSEVGVRKPHPRIYHDALQKLDVAEGASGEAESVGRITIGQVLFVGDSPRCDVQTPQEMGMRAVLVNDSGGRWAAAEYEGVHPDLTVRRVDELPAHLPGIV
jgi:FMN phosphatase YigB (HAD superfamily)